MSSLRVTTVLLPPRQGEKLDGDSRRPTSRGMPREVGRRIKTGENSRPTIGENSTAAHTVIVIATLTLPIFRGDSANVSRGQASDRAAAIR